MIHPERRQENLKKIEEMDKRDAEPLQPDWKTLCMNKKVDMVEVVRCKDCIDWRKLLLNQDGNGQCICEGPTKFDVTAPDFFCAYGRKKDG